MFNKILGKPNVKPIPDNIRESIERELGEFFYFFSLNVGYFGIASDQNRSDANVTFTKMEPLVDLAKASVEKLQELWPAGTLVITHLRKMVAIWPDWFSNFRAWQKLIHDFEDDEIDEIDKGRYQHFVMKNREYASRLDESFMNAKTQLEKYGIDFDAIYNKSNERAMSYLAS